MRDGQTSRQLQVRRDTFKLERRFFASMRRSRAAFVGFVGRRGRGATAARRINSTKRSSASARLRAWVRWRWALIIKTPSRVRRLPASRISRMRTSSGNDGEPRASKRSCTALETLLTFCPPGPEARTKLSSISLSLMPSAALMRIMKARCRKRRWIDHSEPVAARPSGRPTTVTRRPPSNSRLATRRASSSVTALIISGLRLK